MKKYPTDKFIFNAEIQKNFLICKSRQTLTQNSILGLKKITVGNAQSYDREKFLHEWKKHFQGKRLVSIRIVRLIFFRATGIYQYYRFNYIFSELERVSPFNDTGKAILPRFLYADDVNKLFKSIGIQGEV